MSVDYSPQELMVVAAAREIFDGEIVFAGMRLPLIAFALAKETHAPNAIGLFECGLVRDRPSPELLYTMTDPANVRDSLWATRMVNIMGLLAQGVVDVGFIGGAEIDKFGNLNTSYVAAEGGMPNRDSAETKLPGSGGAADIAGLSKRLVVIMQHEKRRLVDHVHYVTSPGYGDGDDWRSRTGLPRGGPHALITTQGIFHFQGEHHLATLVSYHPGQSPDSIRDETGWEWRTAPHVAETLSPTVEELRIIRRYDPNGFWTRAKP